MITATVVCNTDTNRVWCLRTNLKKEKKSYHCVWWKNQKTKI